MSILSKSGCWFAASQSFSSLIFLSAAAFSSAAFFILLFLFMINWAFEYIRLSLSNIIDPNLKISSPIGSDAFVRPLSVANSL